MRQAPEQLRVSQELLLLGASALREEKRRCGTKQWFLPVVIFFMGQGASRSHRHSKQ